MKYVRIDIKRIKRAAWSTTTLTKRQRDTLLNSLRRFGQLVPLVVRELNDGTYETVDGGQRLELFEELGAVAVDVLDLGLAADAAAREVHLALNLNRGKPGVDALADTLEAIIDAQPDERAKAFRELTIIETVPVPKRGIDKTVEKLRSRGKAKATQHNPSAKPSWVEFKFKVPHSAGRVIDDALSHVETHHQVKRQQAIELICADYLAGAKP